MKFLNKETLLKYKSIIGLVIFSIIIALLNDRFLTVPNLLNILRQTSINAVIAAGMTFVILTGGIDLSVGSTVAFSGAIAASLISGGFNVFLSILIALSIGALIGLLNGIIISKGKVQPFIATLATMTLIRGATLVFTDGRPISVGFEGAAEMFNFIGSGYFLGIPIPIYLMILVFAIAYYVLRQTRLGRYVYSLGDNEEATKLSGINTNKIKTSVYMISGLLAALTGIIITARLSSAQPTAGTSAARDRGKGFNEAIDGSDIEVVAKQVANFDRTEGLNVMENILQAEEEIDAVFAHNDEMALGALKAIQSTDRDIMVVGFDAKDDAVKSVEDGEMAATVAQQPKLIGSTGVENAEKIMKDEEVEEFIPVELKLITE